MTTVLVNTEIDGTSAMKAYLWNDSANYESSADSMTRLELGEKLADIRKDAGFKQEALAALAGISRQKLSLIERGLASPHVDELDKMLDACKWTLRRFFDSRTPDTYKKIAHQEIHETLQRALELGPEPERTAAVLIDGLLSQYRQRKTHTSGKD